MNIVVFGAGAIGSLFGAILSKQNKVFLIGRKEHVDVINKKGLKIKGLTCLTANVLAFENLSKINFIPDLVLISVKSYDTLDATNKIKDIIGEKTIVMSLQNGLDNVEKITKIIDSTKIVVCITTHGAIFSRPGIINHTGIGKTVVGAVKKYNQIDIKSIANLLNNTGIKTTVSNDILKDIWIKAIINSSINPLTTIFNCKNGYLTENPVLKKIVERICKESTIIANQNDYDLDYKDMISKTFDVIEDTKDNFSSMLQSVKKNKRTEIDSINGIITKKGEQKKVDVTLNKVMSKLVKEI